MSDTQERQQRANRLQIVAKIVRDGIEDHVPRLTITKAADEWDISRSTLSRILAGDDMNPTFWRICEIGLDLPRRLLRSVADGNVEAIREMEDLDPYLRSTVLAALEQATRPTRSNARKSG
jgi:hypothetical protein